MLTFVGSVLSVRDSPVQTRSSKWTKLFSSHDSKGPR